MDAGWYGAEPSVARRRRSEVFQVGCCGRRASFQGSNYHQSLLLRDAFRVLKLKDKRKAAVLAQCQRQPALSAVLCKKE